MGGAIGFGGIINNFFEQTFVITLERSKKRQQEIEKELKNHNIKFNFIEGVDGSKIDIDALPKSVYDRERAIKIAGFPITQGELGCSLSVLRICKKMVEENISSVLILQDDIKVIENNRIHAEKQLSTVNFPWDIIYLGHSENCLHFPLKIRAKVVLDYIRHWFDSVKYDDPKLIKNSYRRAFSKYWYKAGAHNGGYAFGVSLDGAKKLIAGFTPVFAVDDVTLNYLIRKGSIKAFSPKYFLIDQRWDLESEIGDRPSWNSNWQD